MNLNSELLETTKNDIHFLCYKKLNELGIVNAYTMKGLNYRNREGIHTDYQKVMDVLGIEYQCLVKPNQTHTDRILVIREKKNKNTADINLEYLKNVDALITDKRNIALATTSADCLCIILYDPVKKVIANLHSGWRGTFQKISQKTLKRMKAEFQSNSNDVLAFFMPAIRKCHFEVDEDVMLECQRIFNYMKRENEIIQLGRKIDGVQKYNIDTILINKILLEEEGVNAENIFDSNLCTVCNSTYLHSRRADGEEFGLSTTIAMMK